MDLYHCPRNDCRLLASSAWDWGVLTGHRSLCRLRAGLLNVSHKHLKKSSAKLRKCILCNKATYAPYLHILGECAKTEAHRVDMASWLVPGSPKEVSLQILRASPPHPGFEEVVALAASIEHLCNDFWQKD